MRLESAKGHSRKRLPAALLNSEIASPISSLVGLFAAAPTRILEGSASGRFEGTVRLVEGAGESTLTGKLVPICGSSAISLCAGTIRFFAWATEVFTGAEALVAVSSVGSDRT